MNTTLIRRMASTLNAYRSCIKNGNKEWEDKHEDILEGYNKLLPSGSGIDSGSSIDIDKSRDNRIVINTSFHHLNECGIYDGWTDHQVIITPSLVHDIDIRITGINRNDIKEYLMHIFGEELMEMV